MALAVVSFVGVTMIELNIDSNPSLLLFIFFGAVTAYNFIKYATLARFRHRSLTNSLRAIQIFSLFCFIGLVYFALKQPLPVLVAAGAFGLISLLYVVPLSSTRKNLRSVSRVKIVVIAFSWAGVTIILPALTRDVIYIYALTAIFIQRFLFVVVLTLPFDIRDLGLDEPELSTIPQIYGVENTRTVGIIFLSLVAVIEVLKLWAAPIEIIILIAVVTITYFLVRKSTEAQSKYFTSFWIEGIPILWWLLLLLANKFIAQSIL